MKLINRIRDKFDTPARQFGVALSAVVIIATFGYLIFIMQGQEAASSERLPSPVAYSNASSTPSPTQSTTSSTSTTTTRPTQTTETSTDTVASPPEPVKTPVATVMPTTTAPAPKPTPVVAQGEQVTIGGLRITLPADYGVDRSDGLEAFAVGPDTVVISNHYFQPILRMSANGFNDMPEELGALMEGVCPSGGDVKDYDHKDGEDTMDGDKLVFTRDIYICSGQSYNYASWQLEDGKGGYRFIADYFYPADRRPSELTEAFVNAKSFGHN